ncbi:MAG TPA: methionyl-tRNA formyltransferase [Bryobacteraceae bacterium]|jgi:methionyl-tRNA formyltransferase|nr:methionyl-tRNA formyltransferase [Bryobacteraceae bacterium]
MKIAIVGQQDFGKAVLEAFLSRGDEIAAVFCAPEKEGARPDALRTAAQAKDLPVHQFQSLRDPEASRLMRAAGADIGIMAFVLQFGPEEFVSIPKHGTIQYHPSLLPKYRGPSSINWPIIKGDTETGLTIFRPSDGLDEGPVVLQKKTPIGPDDTLGSVYFDRLFPMGVQAMLEAADLVFAGKHTETTQDESQASYEGWCKSPEARIDWVRPIDQIYNLIRGCNPAPGAWTTLDGRRLQIFDARKTLFRRFADVSGKIGQVAEVRPQYFTVIGQGGMIEVLKAKLEDGKKAAAGEVAEAAGIKPGALLGV